MTQTQELKKKSATHTPKFRPLGYRVLVRRLEAEETLKGGILLPDSAKKKQEKAEVVALGTGKIDKAGKNIPLPVNIGDIILMEKYSGQDVTLDDHDYVIVRGDDIIAVITN